jgi:hypothetical protein
MNALSILLVLAALILFAALVMYGPRRIRLHSMIWLNHWSSEACALVAYGGKWLRYRRQFNEEFKRGMYRGFSPEDLQAHIEHRMAQLQ